MAWTSGHTYATTTTLPANSHGALSSFTVRLTEQDFEASDRGALADFFAAGEYEAALDAGGSAVVASFCFHVDTDADQFTVWVGPVDESAVSSLAIYWRFGASVTHTKGDVFDSDHAVKSPLAGDFDDYSGNGNDGTGIGGVTVGGVIGPDGVLPATSFDGIDDYVEIPDSASVDIAGALRLSADVRPRGTFTFDRGIVSKYVTETADRSYRQVQRADNQLRANVSANGTSNVATESATGVLANDVWQRATMLYVPSTRLAQYVNETQVSENTSGIPASLFNSSTPLWIALGLSNNPVDDQWFDGDITNVAVDSAARSDAWRATEREREYTRGIASSGALALIGDGSIQTLAIGVAAGVVGAQVAAGPETRSFEVVVGAVKAQVQAGLETRSVGLTRGLLEAESATGLTTRSVGVTLGGVGAEVSAGLTTLAIGVSRGVVGASVATPLQTRQMSVVRGELEAASSIGLTTRSLGLVLGPVGAQVAAGIATRAIGIVHSELTPTTDRDRIAVIRPLAGRYVFLKLRAA